MLAALDAGFELVGHFEFVFEVVLDPIPQFLHLSGRELLDGGLNFLYRAHRERIADPQTRFKARIRNKAALGA